MQQFAPVADPENPGRQLNGKPQAVGPRRALGDIGNIGNAQKAIGGKDAAQGRSGVLTRRAAAQLAAVTGPVAHGQGTVSWETRPRASLRPRDANVPVVALPASKMQHDIAEQPLAAAPRPHRVLDVVPAIDKHDEKDPLAAVPFIQHMMAFYQRTEPKVRVAETYMSCQTDINEKMRAILVDWLVDVHLKFKLMPETLYLTVNLIDRFLEAKQVSRKHLQLVGVTAMLVASKYEEIWAPEVRDFVYISDRAYNRDQILNMEKIMLNVLRFNLTVPTHLHFMQRFIKAAGIVDNAEQVQYATYLMELALPEYKMLKFPYSKIAASAVAAACAVFGQGAGFPRELARHSGYSEESLQDCTKALSELYRKASTASLTAVYKKFSQEKHLNVANRDAPPTVDDAFGDALMDA